MVEALEYENRAWRTLETIAKNREIDLEWKSIAEARLHKSKITQVQKELRLIKREVIQTRKELNAIYAAQQISVGKGFGSGLAAGIFGRKAVGSVNASARSNLRQRQLSAIAPYDNVNRLIDSILLQLDQVKLQLDSWMATNSP